MRGESPAAHCSDPGRRSREPAWAPDRARTRSGPWTRVRSCSFVCRSSSSSRVIIAGCVGRPEMVRREHRRVVPLLFGIVLGAGPSVPLARAGTSVLADVAASGRATGADLATRLARDGEAPVIVVLRGGAALASSDAAGTGSRQALRRRQSDVLSRLAPGALRLRHR